MKDSVCSDTLIVSETSNDLLQMISSMIDPTVYGRQIIVTNAAEARRLLSSNSYALVLINAPLPDESGIELSLFAAEKDALGVILMVMEDSFDEVSYAVGAYGIFTLAKPIHPVFMQQALRLIDSFRMRLLRAESEKEKLRTKLEEIRHVDRAKCALIEYTHMTEAQAHRYIEKQAMDRRLPRRVVADEILKIYEA